MLVFVSRYVSVDAFTRFGRLYGIRKIAEFYLIDAFFK